MGSTKQTLRKISAILSIIDSVGMFIAGIFLLSSFGYFGMSSTGTGQVINSYNLSKTAIILMGVMLLILAICSLTGGILLIKNKNRTQYAWGATLTIIGSGFVSLAAILLYISMALVDREYYYVQEPPLTSERKSEEKMDDERLKRQIEVLRQMRLRGEITNDEFKEMMFELIKKS